MVLALGSHFLHKHWLNPDFQNKPLECKITKITRSSVYYRPFYGLHEDGSEWLGSPYYLERTKFEATYGSH